MLLYNDDCLNSLKELKDNSIDLVVTSPPYDNLRTYNSLFVWDFETFQKVANELNRVLKDGGVIVWVVGDATMKGSESGTSFRQALYFKEVGLNLYDTMIYQKKNPIPQNHRRYEQCFEYIFVITKGKLKTFNGITIPTKNAGRTFDWGNRSHLDDNACRRDGGTDKLTVKSSKLHNNIFEYSIGGGKTGHPAVFPLQLAKDMVFSFSNENDIVLDCFMGSGTTGVACKEMSREFIGIEIDENYFKLAKERIEST